MRRDHRHAAWVFALLGTVACGDEEAVPRDARDRDAAASRRDSGPRSRNRRGGEPGRATIEVLDPGTAESGTPGAIEAVVLFEGDPPPRVEIPAIQSHAQCRQEEAPLTEQVIVEDGKLQNVVVYLAGLPAGREVPPPPPEDAVVDQKGCLFVPHVSAVQAGRGLEVTNSDPFGHNVHVFADRNPGENKTTGPGQGVRLSIEHAEDVRLTCDLHPWMNAWVFVVDHPWFGVSGADGTLRIEDVPPGEYRLEAWHEHYGRLRCGDVAVGPGGRVQATITYAP